MLECAANGEQFDGVSSIRASDREEAGGAAQRAVVRAAVLRHLLAENDWAVDPKGVQLRRVRIGGLLDLESASVRCALLLDDCDLDDSHPVMLDHATIPQLVLARCRLAGLSADSVSIAGNLNLWQSVFAGPVVIAGARIEGSLLCGSARVGANSDGWSLMCHGMNVRLSAHLKDFASDGAVALPRAEIGGELRCHDVRLGANKFGTSLHAPGVRIGGAAYFDGEFTARGLVQLAGAIIGGQLRFDGGSLGADADGNSLLCDGMRTGGSVNLDVVPGGRPFTSVGAVRLAGAEITGSLTCRGARLGQNRYGNALVADEFRASVAVLLEGGFTASGAIRFQGAEIGGQLRCEGIQITGADQDGCSLVGDGIKVGGPARLDGGFTTVGAVVLSGADIGGVLSMAGGRLGANLNQLALMGDGIRVDRDLLLSEAVCQGGILLAGAVIGGMLTCRGAVLGTDIEHNALVGDGMKVGRDVLLDASLEGEKAFTAAGAIHLSGADIAGFLSLGGGAITGSQGGRSFVGRGAKVGGSVYLDRGFSTAGSVVLSRATIGGSVACHGATLGTGQHQGSLACERMNIGGGLILDKGFTAAGPVSLSGTIIGRELRWEPGKSTCGPVNLEGARAQYLIDDWTSQRTLAYWPAGRLRLAGFAYDGFGGDRQATVDQRLDWIRSQYCLRPRGSGGTCAGSNGNADVGGVKGRTESQPLAALAVSPFATQPYRQLADVYRQAGQEDEVRIVEITMRRDLRLYGNLGAQRKALNWLLDITIRYGFQTGRALAGILALYLIVFLAFLFAQHQGNLITASNLNNTSLHPTALRCVSGYPCFYPAGYAFDLVVPLINIRQADFWQTNGHHPYGWVWVLATWAATAFGWFLATLLVVGYSGLARRE